MNRYRIEISDEVREEILEAARFIARETPVNAQHWLNGNYERIVTLKNYSEQCPHLPEDEEFHLGLRELFCHSHRIIFLVEKETVRILHVRHVAQDRWRPKKEF
jgi:plasmid stabilization system protein ParE